VAHRLRSARWSECNSRLIAMKRIRRERTSEYLPVLVHQEQIMSSRRFYGERLLRACDLRRPLDVHSALIPVRKALSKDRVAMNRLTNGVKHRLFQYLSSQNGEGRSSLNPTYTSLT
jgi:hypothetical protein